MSDGLAKLQAMSDSPHDYDIGYWWNAVDLAIEEIERLRELADRREKQLDTHIAALIKAEAEVERLQDELRQRDAEIAKLAEHSANRTYQVGELRDLLKERDAEIKRLRKTLGGVR